MLSASSQLIADTDFKTIGLTIKSELCNIGISYCENGSIYIRLVLVEGLSGNQVLGNIQNEDYYPRSDTLGQIGFSSATDPEKFIGASISAKGEIKVWLKESLTTKENLVFQYPVKKIAI